MQNSKTLQLLVCLMIGIVVGTLFGGSRVRERQLPIEGVRSEHAELLGSLNLRVEKLEEQMQSALVEMQAAVASSNGRRETSPESTSVYSTAGFENAVRMLIQQESGAAIGDELDRRERRQYIKKGLNLMGSRLDYLMTAADAQKASEILALLLARIDRMREDHGDAFVFFPDGPQGVEAMRRALLAEFAPMLAVFVKPDRIGEVFNVATGSSLLYCNEVEVSEALRGN